MVTSQAARHGADRQTLVLGKFMGRTLEMLVYGVIACIQIAVVMVLLTHYPRQAGSSRSMPRSQPAAPMRSSLLVPAAAFPATAMPQRRG